MHPDEYISLLSICTHGLPLALIFFFFNDTATTEIYTLFPTRRSSDLGLTNVLQTLGISSNQYNLIAIFIVLLLLFGFISIPVSVIYA